jgi:hypothetical protein
LQKISRKKPILKNRIAPKIEQAVVELAIEQPTRARCGSRTKHDPPISPFGVRCLWLRQSTSGVTI